MLFELFEFHFYTLEKASSTVLNYSIIVGLFRNIHVDFQQFSVWQRQILLKFHKVTRRIKINTILLANSSAVAFWLFKIEHTRSL